MESSAKNAPSSLTRFAWLSIAAALLTIALKGSAYLLTGSVGILSDALESIVNLVGAVMALVILTIASRPADKEHTYGHSKAEYFSSGAEGILILIAAVSIIAAAIQRLIDPKPLEQISIGLGVSLAASFVNLLVALVLNRASKRYNSITLEANAQHLMADVWTSVGVLGGVGVAALSTREWLDPVVALIVAGNIIWTGIRIVRKSVLGLMDTAPTGLVDHISEEVAKVPGVQSIGPIRVRQSGPSTFADLTVGVDRSVSLEEAHQIAEVVEEHVASLTSKSDVIVHVNPVRQIDESITQATRAIANRFGLHTHNIHAHEVVEAYYLDMHVEVPSGLTLKEAHQQVSLFEKAIKSELPHIKAVYTHIEPLSGVSSTTVDDYKQSQEQLEAHILTLTKWMPELHSCHNIRVWPVGNGFDVVLHCRADPNMPIAEAHQLAEQLEKQIMQQIRGVHEVLVHMEPGEDVDEEYKELHGLGNWRVLFNQLRGIADELGLGLHNLHIHDPPEAGYTVEVHLEFPEKVSLGEAHALADKFEGQVKARWPQAEHVVTHLEPLPAEVMTTDEDINSEQEELIHFQLSQQLKEGQLRDLRLFNSGGHLHATITITLAEHMPLTEAHAFTEQIENDLLKQVPSLYRVTLHVEPEG